MFRWQAHKGAIQSLAFSPSGRLLATATGGSRFVHVWDPRTGAKVHRLQADEPVTAVGFAPHAPLLVAAAAKAVRVWDTGGWEPVAALAAVLPHELAVGPGPAPALAASSAGGVAVWGRPPMPGGPWADRPNHVLRAGQTVACLDFAPDGRLATNGVAEAGLWDPAGGQRVAAWDRPPAGNRGAVKFSPDGRRVAYGHAKAVTVRDVDPPADGAGLSFTLVGHRGPVWAVGWSADGRVVMTASGDGTTRLWDGGTGALLRTLDWGAGKIYAAAFAPDGLTAAAGGQTGEVVVWDIDG